MERLTLTVPETAKALGASSTSVWRWIKTGDLPSVRIGGRVFIPRDALRRRLEDHNAQLVGTTCGAKPSRIAPESQHSASAATKGRGEP